MPHPYLAAPINLYHVLILFVIDEPSAQAFRAYANVVHFLYCFFINLLWEHN